MLDKIKKYLGIAIICSMMFQVTVPVGVCVDVSKIKEKIKQNEKNINDLKQKKDKQYKNQKNLNSQIKNVTREIGNLTGKIRKLKNQTHSKQNQINSFVKEHNRLQKDVKNIDSQITQINAASETIKKELLGCLRYIYMNGENNSLDALLSSKNYVAFVNNSTYSEKLSQRTKDVLNSYSQTINSIKNMKNDKEKQMKNINTTKEQIEKNVTGTNSEALEMENLKQKETEHYRTLKKLVEQSNKENKQIAQSIELCEKMNKKLHKELQDSTNAIEKALKKNKHNIKDTKNNIKSSKNHIFPVLGRCGILRGLSRNHHGIDIQTFGKPNPVVASKAGTVIIATKGSKANQLSGYGNVIVIAHGNGETTLYGHLSSILVGVGQVVSQGQVIGRVGNTGRTRGSTGMHLHVEYKNGKTRFNPISGKN